MSATSSGELDALIERATSESIPHGELDLPVALEVSDIIRSRRLTPKECMRCLKRRVSNTNDNPNVQLSSWRLIDMCIKNGGFPFIKEVCSREFMDTIEHTILQSSDNFDVESLVARLLYELHVAFKNDLQFSYVNRVYEKLVARGVDFPKGVQDDSLRFAMFDSRTPADWVDSDACMICSKKFSFFVRRHHCRSCGGVFCQEHSSNSIILPDLGIHEPVRVCDDCFEDYETKKHSSNNKKKRHRSRRKKSDSKAYDEDEQLRKAIELSLRESKSDIGNTTNETTEVVPPSPTAEEENDPELKAAITASLALAEEEKRKREAAQQQQEFWQIQQQQQQQQQQQLQLSSLDVTAAEEEDIHLFASLVERMKGQSATEILEDTQLQRLYQKVIGSRPKINHALNDTVQKYNSLIDMNTKISEIMNVYDDLLERQLQSINLSERYTVPQGPSDPYMYYQRTHQAPAAQRAGQTPQPSQHQSNEIVAPPERHLDQIRDLEMPVSNPATEHTDLANIPSEPPYPPTEEEAESPVLQQEPRKSGEEIATAPYPVDEESKIKRPDQITNFNFPTVPSHKVVQKQPEPVSEPEANVETAAPPKEEELLIEL